MPTTMTSTTLEARDGLDIRMFSGFDISYCRNDGYSTPGEKLPSARRLSPDPPPWSLPHTIPQAPISGALPEITRDNHVTRPTVISERGDNNEWIASSWPSSETSWDSDKAAESREGAPKAVDMGTRNVTTDLSHAESEVSSLRTGSEKTRVDAVSIFSRVEECASKNRNGGDRDNFRDGEDWYETEEDLMTDNGLKDAGENQGQNSRNRTRAGSTICPPDHSTKPTGGKKHSPNQDGREEHEDHSSRIKRPQRLSASLEVAPVQNAPRFACPYQAFEPLLDCLRRGPRNPKGGCEGISRLKQHIHRRHVLSSRCPRCWVSFEKKSRLVEHVQQVNCHEIPRPDAERFMEASYEILSERTNGGTPEDTWWALFRTLIPGIQARTVESLKLEYWPYYISPEVPWSLTATPSLPSIPINLEDPIASQTGEVNFPYEPQTLSIPRLATSLPVTSETIRPQSAVTGANEAIPTGARYQSIIQTPAKDPTTSRDSIESTYPSTGVSTSQTSQASSFSQNSTPNRTPNTTPNSTGASSASTPGSGVIGTTQSRRSYQRLQARSQRAEMTITTLRETNRLVQGDVSRADAILEEVFALEQDGDLVIPAAMYDRLASISQILIDIGERLK